MTEVYFCHIRWHWHLEKLSSKMSFQFKCQIAYWISSNVFKTIPLNFIVFILCVYEIAHAINFIVTTKSNMYNVIIDRYNLKSLKGKPQYCCQCANAREYAHKSVKRKTNDNKFVGPAAWPHTAAQYCNKSSLLKRTRQIVSISKRMVYSLSTKPKL